MSARSLLAVLAVVALASACSGDGDATLPTGPDPSAPTGLVARIVLDTKYGGIKEPERIVIRDAAAWDALWNRLRAAGAIQPVPTPAVDFSRSIALVAILGERDRGGYDIDIPEITRAGESLIAHVRLTVPGPTCSQPEVLTTPLTIVTVSETDSEVAFAETTFIQAC
jgi:hypothetical protein